MTRMRLRSGVLAIMTIIAVSAGGWAIAGFRPDARTPMAQGLDILPADTRVVGLTDWSQIRTILGFDGTVTGIDLSTLVQNSFDRDLSSRSVLADGAEAMADAYGWSVGDISWEAYGQATNGSVDVVGLDSGVDPDEMRSALDQIGYEESNAIWSIDNVASAVPGAGSALTNIAMLDGGRTLVMSENKAYLAGVLRGEKSRDTLAGISAAREAAAPLVGAPSAVLETGKDACTGASFADQSDDVKAQARSALRNHGALRPFVYAGRAILDGPSDQQMRFSMTFGSAAEAGRQLEVRTGLTTGAFIGRTGNVTDSLDLVGAHTDDSTATLEFDFDGSQDSFMAGAGPVLFAACSV